MSAIAAQGHRLAPALVAAGAVAGCVLVRVVDPNESALYPPCPFLALTGRWCPGCGSVRGMNALLRGDVAAAVGFNALLLLMIPFAAYAWATWAFPTVRGRRLPSVTLPPWASWVAAGGIGVFWVARNLPWAPLTALAP